MKDTFTALTHIALPEHLLTHKRMVHVLSLCLTLSLLGYAVTLLSLTFTAVEKKQMLLSLHKTQSELALTERVYSEEALNLGSVLHGEGGYTRSTSASFAVRKDRVASYAMLYAGGH